MADPIEKLLPRFRYGVIHPRANEEFQRGRLPTLSPCAWMSWKYPPDSALENYTPEGVEKAVGNYWKCVEVLAKEKADLIIFSGAPISGCWAGRGLSSCCGRRKKKPAFQPTPP